MPNRRPQLQLLTPVASQLLTPVASQEEAVAIVAALERFMRDTAPPLVPPPPTSDPWRRTALLEGVGHEPDEPMAWPENT